MILEERYTLSNGLQIPKLGLGTWFINDKDVVQAVKDAAKLAIGILILPRHTGMKAALVKESEQVVLIEQKCLLQQNLPPK